MTTLEEVVRLQKRRRWNRKYRVEENNYPEVYGLYVQTFGPIDLTDCNAKKLERLIDPMLRELKEASHDQEKASDVGGD